MGLHRFGSGKVLVTSVEISVYGLDLSKTCLRETARVDVKY